MYLQTETSQTQPQTPNMSIPPESAIIYGTPVVMFSLLLAAVVTIVCRFQDYKGKVKIKLWHENMGFDIALDSQENKDPIRPTQSRWMQVNLKILLRCCQIRQNSSTQ